MKKENKKQFENNVGALWKQTSKGGLTYFTGRMEDGTRLVAFITKEKKNEKEPDIRIYKATEKEEKEEDSFPF